MMNISTSKNTIRTIKQGEPDWLIKNGFTLAPRAGIEISTRCPVECKLIIQTCLKRGWIKPIANVLEKDITWEELIK